MSSAAQSATQSANEERANQIILQVRSATLDPSAVSKVKGLSIESNFDCVLPTAFMTELPHPRQSPLPSELHLDFLLPDNFRETEITSLGGARTVRVRGWSKGHAWDRVKTPDLRTKTIDVGKDHDTNDIYAEFISNLMIFFIAAPELSTLHYSYAGRYDAAGPMISMIDVSGPEQLELRLFVDETVHQLRAVRYTGTLLPYVCPLSAGSEQSFKHGKLDPPGGGIRTHPLRRRADIEIEIQLDDYRSEGEVFLWLPHKATFRAHGRVVAQEEIGKVTLNPEELNPEFFEPGSPR